MDVVKPLARLHREGRITADIRLEYLVSRRHVQQADLVVFCRNVEPAFGGALRTAVELGKPVIYDLDDNFLSIPASIDLAGYYGAPDRRQQLRSYLSSASLVRVYSEHLRQDVSEINAKVVRVDGPLDWSLVPIEGSAPVSDGKVRIVYATSRSIDTLAGLFLEDMTRFLADFRDRVELVFWGSRPPGYAGHPGVRFYDSINNYDAFFRKFARAGFDIGLAPLPDSEFYISKCNNKFREYAACRIAGIYSDVTIYSECVQHGTTGLLVSGQSGSWYAALARLMEDTTLRTRIQDQAEAYAREHYGQDKFCAAWAAQIQAVLAATTTPVVNGAPIGAAGDAAISAAVGTAAIPISSTRQRPRLRMASRMLLWPWRFLQTMRTNGVRETLTRVNWILNDLSIVRWKGSFHG
jgi:glycosyltransferase involved in cell wall biosynthesis